MLAPDDFLAPGQEVCYVTRALGGTIVADAMIESEKRLSAAVESLQNAIGGLKDTPKQVKALEGEKAVLEKGLEKLKGDYETLEAAFQDLQGKFEKLAAQPAENAGEDLSEFKAELKARVDKTIARLEQALS